MKVVSVNIARPTTIRWKGKTEQTGIFKEPVNEIYLGSTDVEKDHVIDRKYHGGTYKACYLYSADHYAYWRERYPTPAWHHGMFGENITLEGLDERTLRIGSSYQLGTAVIRVSEPRLPCYKLGIRFGSQKIVKEFMNTSFCGAYVQVLQAGRVAPGDVCTLLEEGSDLTMEALYNVFKPELRTATLVEKALNDPFINEEIKDSIRRKL